MDENEVFPSGRPSAPKLFRSQKGGSKDKNEERSLPGLCYTVLKWSLRQVLDGNLYQQKVETIPETFSSVEHYLRSFKDPLIEETHADMLSSIRLVHQAPVCRITFIEISKGFVSSSNLYYDLNYVEYKDFKNKRDAYEPRFWDVIALSDNVPACIDDLNRPPQFYFPAMVTGVKDTHVQIYTMNPLISDKHQNKQKVVLFATLLTNIATNIRTWKALTVEKNVDLITEVLQADSKAGERCDVCPPQDTFVLKDGLDVALEKINLNESQMDAVLRSIQTSQCRHKCSVKLIWGPPGTGKTKTIVTMLWMLLLMKCRTLVCAPTNIAVVQMALRLLKLVRESIQGDLYGLGDILLFGNDTRLKVDDHVDLSILFLKHRVDRLAKCSAPLTGWNHQLNSMISLLEDPTSQYLRYVEEMKRKNEEVRKRKNEEVKRENEEVRKRKNEEVKRENEDGDTSLFFILFFIFIFIFYFVFFYFFYGAASRSSGSDIVETGGNIVAIKKEPNIKNKEEGDTQSKDETCDDVLTFLEFIREKFDGIMNDLEYCIQNLCADLPTSFISVQVVAKMKKALKLLKSFKTSFYVDTNSYDVPRECLEVLSSIREEFSLPDFSDRKLIEKFCLKNVCLVFCTASSSANLQGVKPFKLMVTDEAAQLKECESAIPLQISSARHAILIGDEHQLPAMIKSKISLEAGFGRSLFERLATLGHKKHLLNIQYRMHPSISLFPNSEFYDNQISDAPHVKAENYKMLLLRGDMYSSFSFINVSDGNDELHAGRSQRNMAEVAIICEILGKLCRASVGCGRVVSVGVISPYKAQVFAIQDTLKAHSYGTQGNFSVNVNSLDGFQGGEEDVIIISTVRSNENGSVGFLSDPQRANVALTRARYCLWIIGNGTTLLKSDSIWKKVVIDAQRRGSYFDYDKDETLAKALIDSMIKRNQFSGLLNTNSILFRSAKWKVVFFHDFPKSLERLKHDVETKNELFSLLMKLSNGWRNPNQRQRDMDLIDAVSSQLLEAYAVNDHLRLLWTVDIMREGPKALQVLKFWDIVPRWEVAKVVGHLGIIFGGYTVNDINRCKLKCHEGSLEVPTRWELGPGDEAKLGNIQNNQQEELLTRFSSLRLNEGPRRRASSSRFWSSGKKW